MELSLGKIIPAAIFLVTAYQLLSDRSTFFGSPTPEAWQSPSSNEFSSSSGGSSSGGAGIGAAVSTALTLASSKSSIGSGAIKLPKGFTPVVAEPCMLEPERPLNWTGHILAIAGGPGGSGNVKHTAQDCWESCRDWPGCQSWYWCNQREGCTDAHGRQYPFNGCELRSREVIRTLGQVPPSWRLPTFATGFMRPVVPVQQVGAFTMNERGQKVVPTAPPGGLIMTTSIHPKPCKKPHGDLINQLSIINKLDYVRLHGYEFHLFTSVVDKSLTKLYSKVGLLRKLLEETSRERAEWILWIDADTIIQELAFQMPLHLYAGKSFIAWGNEDYLVAGDQRHGVNTGILLLRNDDDFSPKFWKDVARVSRINQVATRDDSAEGQIKAELEDQVQISSSFEDLCDQNVIVYLLRVKAKEYMPHTLLEDGRYCMSCWFKDVPHTQAHAPFVNHWAACQMCTESIPMREQDGGADNAWSNQCRDAFMDNFAFANRTVSMLLGCEQDMIQWGPPLGLPLNDWFDCTGKRGQPTCPPLPPPE